MIFIPHLVCRFPNSEKKAKKYNAQEMHYVPEANASLLLGEIPVQPAINLYYPPIPLRVRLRQHIKEEH